MVNKKKRSFLAKTVIMFQKKTPEIKLVLILDLTTKLDLIRF